MNDKIASKENLIAKYERQIQEQRQRQAEADGGQHAQKLDELEQAKEESERARQDLVDHEGQLAQLAKDLQSAQNRKRAAEDKVREKQNDVERARDSIRHLEQGQRDWTASYHPNLPKLLRDIDNERRFRERPVGPMGRHVKLLKPEWSSILEKSFGASLDAFVVTSKSDQTILSGMMKRLNM
jgi:chromosome segregation ATPase